MWHLLLDQYLDLLPEINYEKELATPQRPLLEVLNQLTRNEAFYPLNNLFWTLFPMNEQLGKLRVELKLFEKDRVEYKYYTDLGLSEKSIEHLLHKVKTRIEAQANEG